MGTKEKIICEICLDIFKQKFPDEIKMKDFEKIDKGECYYCCKVGECFKYGK